MTVGGERKIFFCDSSVADGSRLANAFLIKDLPAQSPVSNSVGSVAANEITNPPIAKNNPHLRLLD